MDRSMEIQLDAINNNLLFEAIVLFGRAIEIQVFIENGREWERKQNNISMAMRVMVNLAAVKQ